MDGNVGLPASGPSATAGDGAGAQASNHKHPAINLRIEWISCAFDARKIKQRESRNETRERQ
jgi:hypothetical protein